MAHGRFSPAEIDALPGSYFERVELQWVDDPDHGWIMRRVVRMVARGPSRAVGGAVSGHRSTNGTPYRVFWDLTREEFFKIPL